jgi:hypothetical protein
MIFSICKHWWLAQIMILALLGNELGWAGLAIGDTNPAEYNMLE